MRTEHETKKVRNARQKMTETQSQSLNIFQHISTSPKTRTQLLVRCVEDWSLRPVESVSWPQPQAAFEASVNCVRFQSAGAPDTTHQPSSTHADLNLNYDEFMLNSFEFYYCMICVD